MLLVLLYGIIQTRSISNPECGVGVVCAALVGACYLASFSTVKRSLDSWHARGLVQNPSSQAGNSTDLCMDLQEDAQVISLAESLQKKTRSCSLSHPRHARCPLLRTAINLVVQVPN